MKFFLHIGAPKTGTSAIQTFMSRNRVALAERHGVVYPSYAHDKAAQRGEPTTGNAGSLAKLVIKRPPDRTDAWVRQCVDGLDPDATVVFSSELLWPIEARAIESLRDGFAPYGELTVFFYTGCQVRQLAAGYWQMVRNNGGRTTFLEYARKRAPAFEFFRRIRLMRRLLGEHNVVLRPYDRRHFPNRDIVLDFLSAVGVPPEAAAGLDHSVVNVNQTADLSMYLMSLLGNRAGIGTEWIRNAMSVLEEVSPDVMSGPRRPELLLPRGDLEILAEAFAADNNRLRKLLGPDVVDMNHDNARFIEDHVAAQATGAATSPMEMLMLASIVQLQAQVTELQAQLSSNNA